MSLVNKNTFIASKFELLTVIIISVTKKTHNFVNIHVFSAGQDFAGVRRRDTKAEGHDSEAREQDQGPGGRGCREQGARGRGRTRGRRFERCAAAGFRRGLMRAPRFCFFGSKSQVSASDCLILNVYNFFYLSF